MTQYWRDGDVLDDVARLRHDVDRLAAGVHAGYTSLTTGDGSLDVVGGGETKASLGDTPAGLGLAVTDPDNRSRMILIESLLERRRQAIYDYFHGLNQNRINEINALKSENATQARQIDLLEGYNQNRIRDIQAANAKIEQLQSKVSRLEGYNQNRINDISNLNSRVNTLQSRLLALEAKVNGGGGGPNPF